MRILLVDGNSEFTRSFKNDLRDKHEIVSVGTALGAIEEVKNNKYDLIIVDWMLPFESAKSFLDWVKEKELNNDFGDTKLWVNTTLDKEDIKKYTNGHKIFSKFNESVVQEVRHITNG